MAPWAIGTLRQNDGSIAILDASGERIAKVWRHEQLIALMPELLDLAVAVAAHFTSTDAPLGQRARDLIAKVK